MTGEARGPNFQLPELQHLLALVFPSVGFRFFFPPFYIHFISLPGGCWRLRCDLTRRAISSGSEATPGAPSYIQSGTRNSLPKEPSPFCQKDPHWPVSFSFDCRGIAEIGEERICAVFDIWIFPCPLIRLEMRVTEGPFAIMESGLRRQGPCTPDPVAPLYLFSFGFCPLAQPISCACLSP